MDTSMGMLTEDFNANGPQCNFPSLISVSVITFYQLITAF